jgi:hypothetical protein
MIASKKFASGLVRCVLLVVLCSCKPTVQPPVTGLQNYDSQKTMSASCGTSVSCIDFDGTGDFAGDKSGCNPGQSVVFAFDSTSYIDLDITTGPLLPNQYYNVAFTDTDANGNNIEGPWTLTVGSTTGGSHWQFHFAVGSGPLSLVAGQPIKGHYTAQALGAFNMISPLITIHAQKTISGTPPLATYVCSVN